MPPDQNVETLWWQDPWLRMADKGWKGGGRGGVECAVCKHIVLPARFPRSRHRQSTSATAFRIHLCSCAGAGEITVDSWRSNLRDGKTLTKLAARVAHSKRML